MGSARLSTPACSPAPPPPPVHCVPVKVNAYLADGRTLNPACPTSGQVYMYTGKARQIVAHATVYTCACFVDAGRGCSVATPFHASQPPPDSATGRGVYSPWTLAGLATETVSRDQLRGAFFGPNTNGETVASMYSACRHGWSKWVGW